jgi:hypothetical protein
MALPNITLDDRTFEQLFAFMRKQIDTVEWTDHNPSDPGISPDACSKSVMENRRLAMAEKNLSHKREALATRVWQIPPRQ